ncbi:MAG: copper-binding protein, partial [Candidatus Acidiferrales bacterium]
MRVQSKYPAFLKRKVRKERLFAQILLGFFLVLALGCKDVSKRYALRGQVVGINFRHSQLVVKHEEIPGFMPAMTMPYDVRNANLLYAVQAGDKIRADLVVPDNGSPWLENIVITDKSQRGRASTKSSGHYLQVGDPVPDVPLVNQDGETILFNQYRGKAVLFTFIYTRCPNQDYCPLLCSDFAAMRKEL